jgi:hypothetical protein
LASCGDDKLLKIWQEILDEKGLYYIKKAVIEFNEISIEDISFCPKTHGLKLAVVLSNGLVMIYEPTDYLTYNIWYSKFLFIGRVFFLKM